MADIRQSTDYSPFGAQLYGRTLVKSGAKESRFGFNGMEGDPELKGKGNSYDFGARTYDCRLGRFVSLDSYMRDFASQSPYAFAGNTPISGVDKNGDSLYLVYVTHDPETNTTTTNIEVMTAEKIREARYFTIPGLKDAISVPISDEYVTPFLSSSDVDVYIMKYRSSPCNTGEAGGQTISPYSTKLALGEDGVFSLDRIPDGDEKQTLGFFKIFNGVKVDMTKQNYFIGINSLAKAGDRVAEGEIVFHEFVHVKYLVRDKKLTSADAHHKEMGSQGLGLGNDLTKPVPQFRKQLSEKLKKAQEERFKKLEEDEQKKSPTQTGGEKN